VFRRRRAGDDFAAEIEAHIELEVERLSWLFARLWGQAAGASPPSFSSRACRSASLAGSSVSLWLAPRFVFWWRTRALGCRRWPKSV
jgi:hypothetical protein